MRKIWFFGFVAAVGFAIWLGAQKSIDSQNQEATPKEKVYAEVFSLLPSGENVSNTGEIVVTFDRNVVAIGSMQREEIDIKITPEVECKWRWLNRSSLACILPRDKRLKLATNYNLTISKNFSKEDNIELSAPYSASFSTIRPSIKSSYTLLWQTTTKPYIELSFFMPVTKKSVLEAFKIIGADKSFDVELIERVVKEEISSTSVEYRADTSSQTLAKSSWILSPKTALESDTEFDLALVGSLYGEEGELASNKEYRHNFHTFGEFKFLGLSCEVSDKEKLLSVESSKEELQKNRCDPLAPISLVFSSPVSQKSVAEFVEFSPKLNFLADSYNPWENLTDNDSFDAKHKRDKVYMVRLPNFIKADSTHTLDTKKLKDIFGQELQGRYEISFMTDHRKPNLTLGYSEIVLEKGVHSDAALFATNLKNIKLDFIRFNENADKIYLTLTI